MSDTIKTISEVQERLSGVRTAMVTSLHERGTLSSRPVTLQEIDGRLFPLGFVKLLRDVKKTKRFRLMLLGVLERYQGRGYEVVFSTEVMERGLKLGFTECEMSNDPASDSCSV